VASCTDSQDKRVGQKSIEYRTTDNPDNPGRHAKMDIADQLCVHSWSKFPFRQVAWPRPWQIISQSFQIIQCLSKIFPLTIQMVLIIRY
jgi:hypothetical protein